MADARFWLRYPEEHFAELLPSHRGSLRLADASENLQSTGLCWTVRELATQKGKYRNERMLQQLGRRRSVPIFVQAQPHESLQVLKAACPTLCQADAGHMNSQGV